MANINRRRFLSTGAAMGMLGGGGTLGLLANQRAFAADVSGYKALVCIFLKGGLDHADTIFPHDQESYDILRGSRSQLMNAHSTRGRDQLLRLNAANECRFWWSQLCYRPANARGAEPVQWW